METLSGTGSSSAKYAHAASSAEGGGADGDRGEEEPEAEELDDAEKLERSMERCAHAETKPAAVRPHRWLRRSSLRHAVHARR